MKRLLLAVCLAAACGGAAEDADLADVKLGSTEPITWVSLAQQHAATYAKSPTLMSLHAHPTDASALVWDFVFADWTAGNWVTVQCDGHTARVVEHHHNAAEPMGTTAIHQEQVKVSVAKLMTLAAKAGLEGKVTEIDLSEALTMDMHPHWFLTQGGKEIAVDADTGKLFN